MSLKVSENILNELKQSFTVTFTHYDTIIAIAKKRSNLQIDKVIKIFKSLLLAVEFNKNINNTICVS